MVIIMKKVTAQEESFREWMRRQLNADGIRRYTDTAIIAYCHTLRTSCQKLAACTDQAVPAENLFSFSTPLEYEAIYREILQCSAFEKINQESGHGTLRAAMDLYSYFLSNGKYSQAPDMSTPYYLKQEASIEEPDSDEANFLYEEIPMTPLQKVYYGVPGTGKSFRIRSFLDSLYPDPAVRDAHCRRVIFHPTYTYDDFVGCIRPRLSSDRELYYVYVPGPFTSLLKESFLHPAETYYLVIEEINRGNAPSIFGDLFQLLDRQDSGKSMYAIQNNEILAYFSRDPALKDVFAKGQIWLPANFNLLATMNTADENIFVLDNAFKRRFALEYVGISFENLPESWTACHPAYAGKKPLPALFAGTPLEGCIKLLERQGQLARNWPTFALLSNYLIDYINQKMRASGKNADTLIAENKKLGPFFLSEAEVCDRNAFLNKVIFYLKQDVFFTSSYCMTASFEAIYEKYQHPDSDLFELLLPQREL